jgi:hypothetical protein
MKTLPEPTSLLCDITHREMLDWMADNGIFCSPDKMARILQEAQRRALADQAKRDAAMDRMVADAESLNLYEEANKEQA